MKDVWRFISIIFVTFTILAAYSFSSKTIKIGDVEIKKIGINKFIVGDTMPQNALKAVEVKEVVPKMDSTPQNILLIGDSMLEQLRWCVRDYCEANGHNMNTVMWYSSQSMWFGKYDTLKYFMDIYKPTYVILVLGANELFVSDIKDTRADFVKEIVKDIGETPFVWVGPPNWKTDTGINELIMRYARNGRYFPTYKISLNNPNFGRYKDGAHPLPSAAEYWMDELAVWIMQNSDYPILLNKPEHKGEMSTNTIILQPLK